MKHVGMLFRTVLLMPWYQWCFYVTNKACLPIMRFFSNLIYSFPTTLRPNFSFSIFWNSIIWTTKWPEVLFFSLCFWNFIVLQNKCFHNCIFPINNKSVFCEGLTTINLYIIKVTQEMWYSSKLRVIESKKLVPRL